MANNKRKEKTYAGEEKYMQGKKNRCRKILMQGMRNGFLEGKINAGKEKLQQG